MLIQALTCTTIKKRIYNEAYPPTKLSLRAGFFSQESDIMRDQSQRQDQQSASIEADRERGHRAMRREEVGRSRRHLQYVKMPKIRAYLRKNRRRCQSRQIKRTLRLLL